MTNEFISLKVPSHSQSLLPSPASSSCSTTSGA